MFSTQVSQSFLNVVIQVHLYVNNSRVEALWLI